MMLYSYRGGRPAPLPWRIILSNGFSRTDPSTFREEELRDAGFEGPYTEPTYNPNTHILNWVNGGYITVSLPPPEPVPQWVQFAQALAGSDEIKALLWTAEAVNPVLREMLGVGLGQAAQGDSATFLAAWRDAVTADLVSAELAAQMQLLAAGFDLPQAFISGLQG